MASKNGWWTLECTVEPTDTDLEHIAEAIKDGFTEGEIIEDEGGDEDANDEETA